jgi:hypothetical protein
MKRRAGVPSALLNHVTLFVVSPAEQVLETSPDGKSGGLNEDLFTLTTAPDILEGITVTIEPRDEIAGCGLEKNPE